MWSLFRVATQRRRAGLPSTEIELTVETDALVASAGGVQQRQGTARSAQVLSSHRHQDTASMRLTRTVIGRIMHQDLHPADSCMDWQENAMEGNEMTTTALKRAHAQFGTAEIFSLGAPLKRARMELKTTDAAKELLSLAAALDGTDLTAFILNTAVEKARKVVSEHSAITLTREGQEVLARLLQSPSKPTKAMRELMSLPDLNKA
jgi:uncharacterized protein (DUF1778 family)